jgi:hypothetical protein
MRRAPLAGALEGDDGEPDRAERVAAKRAGPAASYRL